MYVNGQWLKEVEQSAVFSFGVDLDLCVYIYIILELNLNQQ